MTWWRRLATAGVAGGLVLTLSGCPVGDYDRTPEALPSAADAGPVRPTDASTDLPAYTGPPAGGPSSAGPVSRVRAAVDLTPATPGTFAVVVSAVAGPDSGAFALLSPIVATFPQSLVTLRGDGIAAVVSVPRVEDVWGLHLLDGGAVAVTGRLADEGYGLRVVDPVTGAVRTTVLLPPGDGVRSSTGRSAVSTSATRLYVFMSVVTDAGVRETLLAVDGGTGRVLAERDLSDDVAATSTSPVGDQLAGLLPRPSGGVTLVFDAAPTDDPEDRIP